MNSKYVKIEMINKNITAKEISEKLDININTVSRWINGKNTNQIETFLKLILLLELDIKKLLD